MSHHCLLGQTPHSMMAGFDCTDSMFGGEPPICWWILMNFPYVVTEIPFCLVNPPFFLPKLSILSCWASSKLQYFCWVKLVKPCKTMNHLLLYSPKSLFLKLTFSLVNSQLLSDSETLPWPLARNHARRTAAAGADGGHGASTPQGAVIFFWGDGWRHPVVRRERFGAIGVFIFPIQEGAVGS